MPEKRDPFPEFEDLVNRLVEIPDEPQAQVGRKIDLLERLIEQWRIKQHRLTNDIEFEEFLIWEWFVDQQEFLLKKAGDPIDWSAGTPPLRLQRQLLVFLLLHHGKFKDVLECIEKFVRTVRDSLKVQDFKKTKTGVFRCFTNTRFAANKLRDSGLLKFTRNEAFKVWILSLPGIVVAAKALQSPGWNLPDVQDPWHGLDPFIQQCSYEVERFDGLVSVLTSICGQNTKVFETFESVLREAHRLLFKYWEVFHNPELTAADREKKSREHVEQLDLIIGYPEFIEEFVCSIQIETLLKQADEAAARP